MSWGEAVVISLSIVLAAFVAGCAYSSWWAWRNPIAAEKADLEQQRRKERRQAARRRAEMKRREP